MTTALLTIVMWPIVAAVSPEAAKPPVDSTMPAVAMTQPLATIDGTTLVAQPSNGPAEPVLPEPGMLMLVGGALIGLAAIVRRAT